MMRDAKVIATVACRLKLFRERARYTQKEVSKITGITEVSISRYENMERVPDALMLYKLAECYGVSVADFYKSGGS